MKITVSDVYCMDHYFEGDYLLEIINGGQGVSVKLDVYSAPLAVFPFIRWAKINDV